MKHLPQLPVYFQDGKQYPVQVYVKGGVKGGIHIKLKRSWQAFFNLAPS